jgi:hypothetical protein
MRLSTVLLLSTLVLAATPQPAAADATAFLGATTTPSSRPVRGFAGGVSLLVVGFEFEYANTPSDEDDDDPSLRTFMGNVLLQTPFPIAGMQFYFTTGAGGFRERLADHQETHLGVNTGGGVKVSLFGPLRVRLDYRVFKLRGEPLHSVVHRVYAGANLAF